MKFINLMYVCVVGLLSTLSLAAAPPDTLTLTDLINRPDRWPATLTIPQDLHLASGAIIHQGDQVHIALFDGTRVGLIAKGNIRFAMPPQDCGLLDASNQAWSTLTPAQRAIDKDSLPADLSLWPVKVAVPGGLRTPFGSLAPNAEVSLLKVTNKNLVIIFPNSNKTVALNIEATDIIARARQLALIDPAKRDSRIAAALQDIIVDADGKPWHDDHLADKKFFALYFGAGWCPPCRAFSPDLVKFMTGALPAHPELLAVLLSNDHQPADMLAYMKDEKMPFPAIYPADLDKSPLLVSYVAVQIPHIVIVDRFGKVLISNVDADGNLTDGDASLDALNTC